MQRIHISHIHGLQNCNKFFRMGFESTEFRKIRSEDRAQKHNVSVQSSVTKDCPPDTHKSK